jgi:hypothetical protein
MLSISKPHHSSLSNMKTVAARKNNRRRLRNQQAELGPTSRMISLNLVSNSVFYEGFSLKIAIIRVVWHLFSYIFQGCKYSGAHDGSPENIRWNDFLYATVNSF